jgi:hypothetical protein
MIRRLAFLTGLLLGLASVIQAGTAILTYFLTGRLPAVEVEETAEGRSPVFKLVSTDDVLEMVKEQAARRGFHVQVARTEPGLEGEVRDAG